MVKIDAILFDLDGVLIDAKDWHYEALNKALRLFGYEISRYDHLITYDGLPTKIKLEMLSRERGLPHALHPIIAELKQKYTNDFIFNNCKPRFEHEFAVSRLKAEGYKLAVCSNAIKESVELMLTKSNLISYFDIILSNQDVKKPKPDPEIYLVAMEKLRVQPSSCLVIEDNEKGIAAAKEAGAHVLVVRDVSETNYANIKRKINSIQNNRLQI